MAIAVILVGLVLVTLLVKLAYGAWVAHEMTSVERVAVFGHPTEFGLHWESIDFPSHGDRVALSGWYFPAGQDEWCIILVQGTEHHRNSPDIMALQLGADLVACEFSAFLFDFRGRGESGGERSSEGDREQWDTLGAVDYVAGRGIPLERIGLLGFSLGASVSILVAAQEPRIPAVVSDSGFSDYLMDLSHLYVGPVRLPAWYGVFVVLAGRLFFKSDLSLVRPIQVVDQVESPIYFIHGENDPIVSAAESSELHEARDNREDRLWMVRNAEHVNVYRKHPEEYIARFASFFERHMV